jgi:hypothetical protein
MQTAHFSAVCYSAGAFCSDSKKPTIFVVASVRNRKERIPYVLGDGVCNYVWNVRTFLPNCTSHLGRQKSFMLEQKLVFHSHPLKTYRRSGGVVPHIINLGTNWRSVVSIAPWPLKSQERTPVIELESGRAPEPVCVVLWREIILSLSGYETRIVQEPHLTDYTECAADSPYSLRYVWKIRMGKKKYKGAILFKVINL